MLRLTYITTIIGLVVAGDSVFIVASDEQTKAIGLVIAISSIPAILPVLKRIPLAWQVASAFGACILNVALCLGIAMLRGA